MDLVLFILLLELLDLNLKVRKGHMEFQGTFIALLYFICNSCV